MAGHHQLALSSNGRTLGSQPRNTGSIPVGATDIFIQSYTCGVTAAAARLERAVLVAWRFDSSQVYRAVSLSEEQ